MQQLFRGKRKFITIPTLLMIGLLFLPFTLGISIGYVVYKKVPNSKLKYTILTVITLFTLFFGTAWVAAMGSPNTSGQNQAMQTTPTPQSQTTSVEVKQDQIVAPIETNESSKKDKQEAKVVKVIDGDTVKVMFNDKTETIRFIGINSPETVDPRKPVECFGEKVSMVAKENLTGKTIWLETDPSQGDRDKYDRLLRYVWIDDATMDFGKVLITTGYAYEYTYDNPYKYQIAYRQAQEDAEQSKKGLWADNACPVSTPQPIKKSTSTPTQSPNNDTPNNVCKYSCSGPDRDCSDFSSHAEAQTFFDCCGFTVTNDPMRLDSVGVGDGVACESI